MSREDLLNQIDAWVACGWLRPLDRAFMRFLGELDAGADTLLLLAVALASHQLGRGHICLDLQATLLAPDETLALPPE
ncbi:MAG: exodeoxyribonuclease V subunit alpha, partial [Candidatus Methylumidiphilus sp.]